MLWDRTRRAPLNGLLAVLFLATTASAQPAGAKPAGATRAQLVAQARLADSLRRTEEAFRLRNRLQNGDFEVGDRVLATYEGIGLTRGDTLVVQTGKIVRLGEPMGDLNVGGLLVFELADSVRARIGKYFKDEVVHVMPLLRLQMSGAVRAPGFYYARSDVRLSDALMRSGGQDQGTDLENITIKRGDQTLWSPGDVSAALRDGLTLEHLGLEPGDEIVVGAKKSSPWGTVMQVGGTVLTALLVNLLYRRGR